MPHEAGHILIGRTAGLPVRGLDHFVIRGPNDEMLPGNFATVGVAPMSSAVVLVPKLARLVGHRIGLHREPIPSGLTFSYSASGLLLYRLDAGEIESLGYMEVDQSAKTDDFATKTIQYFQNKARRFFSRCSRPEHVEEVMLTGEQAFWDDLVLSFKYPKNSHYSSANRT